MQVTNIVVSLTTLFSISDVTAKLEQPMTSHLEQMLASDLETLFVSADRLGHLEKTLEDIELNVLSAIGGNFSNFGLKTW